jgi:hypothetical protein
MRRTAYAVFMASLFWRSGLYRLVPGWTDCVLSLNFSGGGVPQSMGGAFLVCR